MTSADRRPLTIVLFAAFAVRIAAAIALPEQPGLPDAVSYRAAGHQFWTTLQINNPLNMPLYPILIGLTGTGWPQLLLDISLSTAMVWLVHQLTLVLFGDRRAALLAALATAFYPFFIFYALIGMTETLFIVLVLGAFLAWYRGAFWLGSVGIVLAILTRPTVELLAPALVCIFALVIHRLGASLTIRHLVGYALIYLALMTPWWVHNYVRYGGFVHLNLGGGIALYAGNNPMNHSGGGIADVDYDPHIFDDIRDPIRRDRRFRDAALEHITAHPAETAALAVKKFLRFWRPWPYTPLYSSKLHVLVSLASFLPVLLLAIAYFPLRRRGELRRVTPLLLFIANLTAVHMITVSSIRYRLPVEPFLIILASCAFVRLLERASLIRPEAETDQRAAGLSR